MHTQPHDIQLIVVYTNGHGPHMILVHIYLVVNGCLAMTVNIVRKLLQCGHVNFMIVVVVLCAMCISCSLG